MIVGPAIGRDEVSALQAVAASRSRSAIGLHATLTAPFRPLTIHFQPIDGGMFLGLPRGTSAECRTAVVGAIAHGW